MRTGRRLKRARAVIVAGAAAGFAGVIAFHTGATAPPVAGTPAAGAPAATGTPATGATPTGPASPGPAGKTTGGSAGHHRAHHAPAVRSATGPPVNFSYGTIAVRITVRGTRVTRVRVASLSTLEPTSQAISSQALPALRAEVLNAQSASINGVSGATYTSQGYARSVQAALDQMHV
jgi:uncharacterized protein with FMN-binding domain